MFSKIGSSNSVNGEHWTVFLIFHLLHDNLQIYKQLTSKPQKPFLETQFTVQRIAVHRSLDLRVNKRRNNSALLCVLVNY